MPHLPGHGLLNGRTPDPPWLRPQLPPSLLASAETWANSPEGQMDPVLRMQQMNRERAMSGDPNFASIGPKPSFGSRILDQVRYAVPRVMKDFGQGLARETPRGLLSLARDVGAESVGGPGGWITNLIDQPWSPRAPETGAGQAGGFGGMLTSEVVAGLGADAASAKRGVGELLDPQGSTAVGLLELASSVPFLGMAAVPALRSARQGLDAMSTSRLETAIANAPSEKATGSQWQGQLRKAPGGVPSGEMEWTGITGLLGDNPDRVFTRQELLQIMDERGVKLKETWRGGSGKYSEYTGWDDARFESELAVRTNHAQSLQAAGDHDLADEMFRQVDQITHAQEELAGFGPPGTPKFGDYRIEGPSENYRELTIQLDNAESGNQYGGSHFGDPNVLVHLRMSDRTVRNPETGQPETVLFLEEIQSDWHQRGRSQGYQEPRTPDPEEVRLAQEEFDAAKAEVDRITNETVVEAEKVAANEVQLDKLPDWDGGLVDMATTEDGYVYYRQPDGSWATEGGDAFPSGEALRMEMAGHGINVNVSWGRRNVPGEEVFRTNEAGLIDNTSDRQRRLSFLMNHATQRRNRASAALSEAQRTTTEGVPRGPYEKTGEWTELAMRRAIIEAVEGGYDRVAWASGRQASELYDLQKYVTDIMYDPNTGKLQARGLEGEVIISETGITPEQLPEYIGKEPAERLMAADVGDDYVITEFKHATTGEPRFMIEGPDVSTSRATREEAEEIANTLSGTHFIEGEDLAVGGEGMIGFYDRIIPRTTKKYGNQVGGIEIEDVAVSNRIPDGAEDLTAAQLKQGVKELGIEENPFIKEWIRSTELTGNSTDAVNGWPSLERRRIRRYEDRILGHLKTSPESGVMTNQSFAITPEMRAIVGQGDQRLWGTAGIGLFGANAAARSQNNERDPYGGLLQPPIGPPLLPRR